MANEKRLIRADDALASEFTIEEGGAIGYVVDSEVIRRLPTVDAVEVVHGRWIFKHNPITDPKKYFIRIVCSECNLHTGQKSNYCPNCGAKMDGGNEDV